MSRCAAFTLNAAKLRLVSSCNHPLVALGYAARIANTGPSISMVEHLFGGPWTEIKLDAVQYYLECYAKALTPKKFDLWYIDAFAGTGDRVETRKVGGLLEGIPESTVTETLAGAARRALKGNNATMLLWIKVGGVIFFLGVLAFA